MATRFRNVDTALIHAGELDQHVEGALILPIFQSSTFEYTGQTSYADLRYIRLNNTPNHQVLHEKLACLEGAEAALVTGSGMAAISATLLTVLSAGDHLLAQNTLYGGTYDFLTHDFGSLGLSFGLIDATSPETWNARLTPQTKAIYVESVSNPLMQVADLTAVVAFARQHNLVSIIDNTFLTPLFYRPLEEGFDLVVHSATKYLNGHSDLVAGTVAGSSMWIKQINARLMHLGGSLDPHACFLMHRGLKTLALRMRQQHSSALAIAEFLDQHPEVCRVYYPGLTTDPYHQRAAEIFDGYGGMLSFELDGGKEQARHTLQRLQLATDAPSLGGVESLATRPVTTSHSGLSPEAQRQQGITDGLIRFSVGIEAAEDLIDDLKQAIEG
jgi:cystathionine beta-lyase/cystathionine gamma-synthase